MNELIKMARAFGDKIYYSIFRHRFDNTGLTKSKIMFSNVMLHIQPVKIHKRTVKFKTTMGMGLITFYLMGNSLGLLPAGLACLLVHSLSHLVGGLH